MFQSAYEELTLICSIIDYLRESKEKIDVEYIRELITKSPLDNDHKHLIIEYLKHRTGVHAVCAFHPDAPCQKTPACESR